MSWNTIEEDGASGLLVDLYELTMAQSYFREGVGAQATFSLFARHLPDNWGFFLAAGMQDALDYLERLRFTDNDVRFLRETGLFDDEFLAYLAGFRFGGSVWALPEGTACLPDEPLLEVTAPMIEAQLPESMVLNIIHFETILASKAARGVLAADGRRLVDFSLRRTHGGEAALKVARCAYLAGFDATSNVLAGLRYGIPIAGTMAHSYVQAFESEIEAFRAYARTYPDQCILLIDTYDTEQGAVLAARVGQELAAAGHRLRGVRLDSGDLKTLSRVVRQTLDRAGLSDATIFVSGGLDEHVIADFARSQTPIDAFGVGSRLGVSADAPYLDMAYKLVEYDGRPTLKLSSGKATWPGAKQIWRRRAADGTLVDRVGLALEAAPPGTQALLEPAMLDGLRLSQETLVVARERARREVQSLPAEQWALIEPVVPRVEFSDRLCQTRERITAGARWAHAVGTPNGRG